MSGFREKIQGLAVYRSRSTDSSVRVVLIHGAVDRAAGLIRVARQIGDAEVIRYDRRGYGRSDSVGSACTFEQHVDDLELIIGDRPAVLFGHSYGGSIALGAVSRGNPFVRAAVSYEAPRTWEPWWPPPPVFSGPPLPGRPGRSCGSGPRPGSHARRQARCSDVSPRTGSPAHKRRSSADLRTAVKCE